MESNSKTVKQWKYNVIMLETPEQNLKTQIIGYIGSMVGLLIAMIIMVFWRNLWFICIPMAFSELILWANLKQILKHKQLLDDIKKENKEEPNGSYIG